MNNTKEVLTEKDVNVPKEVHKFLQQNPDKILIPASQLETLLNLLKENNIKIAEADAERQVLIKIAFEIMNLFGYIDPKTGKMKPEVLSGEESFIPGMLKSLGDVTSLLIGAKNPFKSLAQKNKDKLQEKFAFVQILIPLLQKYGNEQGK
jgi:hypothetical protein